MTRSPSLSVLIRGLVSEYCSAISGPTSLLIPPVLCLSATELDHGKRMVYPKPTTIKAITRPERPAPCSREMGRDVRNKMVMPVVAILGPIVSRQTTSNKRAVDGHYACKNGLKATEPTICDNCSKNWCKIAPEREEVS